MIRNLWTEDHVKFYCLGHEKPIPLKIYNNECNGTRFFVCPKYMAKDEAHPDGHESDEPSCYNRVSFGLAKEIMERISSLIEQHGGVIGVGINLTGYKCSIKGIQVKVLSQKGFDFKIGLLNTKSLQV